MKLFTTRLNYVHLYPGIPFTVRVIVYFSLFVCDICNYDLKSGDEKQLSQKKVTKKGLLMVRDNYYRKRSLRRDNC